MVHAMHDLVRGETERIDSCFLEPACGSGIPGPILRRKLPRSSPVWESEFERRHYAP